MRWCLLTGWLVVSALVSTSLEAAKPEPIALTPASPWTVNYADDSCRLLRTFGTGDEETILIFDRLGPGQDFRLFLVGKRFSSTQGIGRSELRFGPAEQSQRFGYFTGDLGKDRPAIIIRGSVRVDAPTSDKRSVGDDARDPIPVDRIAAVKELTVGSPLRKPVRFGLGSMRAPFAALDKCVDDLVKGWGLDPVTQGTLQQRVLAKGDPSKWVTSEDYPASAQFKGAQGIVHFRLAIDETGKSTGCHIQQSTRPAEFDETVCRTIMQRARFTPALDKGGKPIASFYRSTVTFTIG
jgi:TonB family protein